MKRMILATAACLVLGSVAAADTSSAADGGKETVTTSKNPITGTVTTKKVYKQQAKDASGQKADVKITETHKVHKNGQVDDKVEAKAESHTNQ